MKGHKDKSGKFHPHGNKRRGISADVLRGRYESTNGGVSSKYDSFLIIDPSIERGNIESKSTTPELKLVRRNLPDGSEYVHAEPLEAVKEGNVGYMFGGNFIHTSDSRFPNHYPIPIHDRQETQEQYNHLSV